jgi:hypothetical protein
MPALPPRRVGGLLRLDLLQHGRQPLVVDDRAGLHCVFRSNVITDSGGR